ncbi:DUF2314 domain-containing protein [Caulobacter sp. SLTY]|uniref:YegJ family protein n=1 Tax=Caulobacter sp. SLTY TaxID=2683262 RepID=UPI0014129239|nr:DUF2314 domain-containing protein [Caulobacter sp. SLTY]NBB16059.1 DUF2314 domain-containing protein [Caulobacter sp. SLTY]
MKPFALLLAAVLVAAPMVAFAQSEPTENVLNFSEDDRAMNAAIGEARRTLPDFWRRFESDQQVHDSALLKVRFPVKNGGSEYMWVRDISRPGGKITGILDNVPTLDVGVREGDRVTVDPADITDWVYDRGGRRWGGFTIRVHISRLTGERADQIRQVLSDTPVEP